MKKVLLGVLISFSLLAGLEIALRLSDIILDRPPLDSSRDNLIYQNKLWQNQLFSGFLGVHQFDPYLLWKFKPNLHKNIFVTNSKGTLGPEFTTEKPRGRFRILLLGDSSPVGLGLPSRKEALGEQFLQLLKRSYPGQDIELINASVSGYTSAQGLVWFKKYGVKLKLDLLILYFGNNDASYNGFAEDKQVLSNSLWLFNLRHFLGKFAIYQTWRGILLPLKEKFLSHPLSDSRALKLRVSAEDYYYDLEQMIQAVRETASQVLLVTVPVPREWPPAVEFKPFVNLKTAAGQLAMAEQSRTILSAQMAYCLDWPEIKQKYPQVDYWTLHVLLQVYADTGEVDSSISAYQEKLGADSANIIYLNNLAVLHWRKRDYLKSLQFITQALARDSSNASLHYNLGMIEKKLGDTLSARAEFEKAKELDFYSLRSKNIYNDKIRLLAREHNLLLVDLDSLFLQNNNEFLFIDHCHPKAAGHRLIAEALLQKVKQAGWLERTQSH